MDRCQFVLIAATFSLTWQTSDKVAKEKAITEVANANQLHNEINDVS